MAVINLTSELLKTQLNELSKMYITYDASNRPEYVYTCGVNTLDGKPCTVVRYSYDGVSTRVVYMKEYTSTWQTAWETF